MITRSIAVLAGLALGQAAAAAVPAGTILFTSNELDSVGTISNGGTVTTLVQFTPGDDIRLADIIAGPNGEYYAANGPTFPTPAPPSGIFRFDNLLSGAPVTTTLTSGEPLVNPIGLAYDSFNNRIWSVSTAPVPTAKFPGTSGIIGVDPANGNQTVNFQGPPGDAPEPAFRGGLRIESLPNTNDFLVLARNGGIFDSGLPEGDAANGSALWRYSVDGNLDGSVELIVDLSTPEIIDELGAPITLANSFAVKEVDNGTEVYLTDGGDKIRRITLDNNGDFVSIEDIYDINFPGEVVYDEFNDALVFTWSSGNPSGPLGTVVSRLFLDDLSRVDLATGLNARGLLVIPTPGVVGVLGLAGFTAIRRRR